MDLREAMASGVFIEFRDVLGNSAGTAVYFDWSDRPLPAVGDRISCPLIPSRDGVEHKLSGRVKHRAFDIQKSEDGRPCLWVRIVVDIGGSKRAAPGGRTSRMCFSDN
jgi:hypothetical protein